MDRSIPATRSNTYDASSLLALLSLLDQSQAYVCMYVMDVCVCMDTGLCITCKNYTFIAALLLDQPMWGVGAYVWMDGRMVAHLLWLPCLLKLADLKAGLQA